MPYNPCSMTYGCFCPQCGRFHPYNYGFCPGCGYVGPLLLGLLLAGLLFL